MRDSTLISLKNFGPYIDLPNQLKLNDVQSMVFKSDDYGPFYMKPEEAEARKYDKKLENLVRNQ